MNTGAQPHFPFKYLVLKGGGIRGIAYSGAVKVLEDEHIIAGIERVGGTSIGAVVAAMICVGIDAHEMDAILQNLDIGSFNDGEWYLAGGSRRMRRNYGWYKGDELEKWVGDFLAAHTGSDSITFGQLHALVLRDKRYKDLYVTATNLSKQRAEIFSWENMPDMQVKVGVRTSVSIPLYYTAVLLDSVGNIHRQSVDSTRFDVYADGGITANYPVTMFNTPDDNAQKRINEYTLGLKLDRPEQIGLDRARYGLAPYKISSLRTYFGAFFNITIEQLNPPLPYDEERKHTIYISHSNLSPRVRKITAGQKKLLYDNGVAGAKAFFGLK